MSGHDHNDAHGGGGLPPAAHEEGHEGAPEWLISFADNTALIMGFFVILLALNMGPKGTAAGERAATQAPSDAPFAEADVAIAIREAFNNPVDATSTDPKEEQLVRRLRELRGDERAQDQGPRGARPYVQSLGRGEHHSPAGTVLFDRDSTELDGAGMRALADLAEHLRGVQLMVEIRGHVSAAEAIDAEDRGMRLSFERALTVGEELVRHGFVWRQLRIQACGDGEPVAGPVYEWEGHKANQRAEIMVLDVSLMGAPAEGDRQTHDLQTPPESPAP